jgi:serine/threonine protein kinase
MLQSIQKASFYEQQQPAASIVKLVKIYGDLQQLATDTKRGNNNNVKNASTMSSSKVVHIVMELATGGNLQSYVMQHGALSEDRVQHIAVDLLYGILYLQQQSPHRLCHVNLQPSNILLQYHRNDAVVNVNRADVGKRKKSNNRSSMTSDHAPPRAVICDFGSACRLNGVVSRLPHELHMQYAAPEILQHQTCNAVTDMWSIGAILYFCLFGNVPPITTGDHVHNNSRGNNDMSPHSYARARTWDLTFPTSMPPTASDKSSPSQVEELSESRAKETALIPSSSRQQQKPSEQRPLVPPPVSRQAKQLISACLHCDPTVRLTVEEALAHPWLADIVAAKTIHSSSSSSSTGKNGGKGNSGNSTLRQNTLRHHGREWLFGRFVTPRRWPPLLFCSINNKKNVPGPQDDDDDKKNKKKQQQHLDLTPATTMDTEQQYQQQQQQQLQQHRK